jgi:hypothetical protein
MVLGWRDLFRRKMLKKREFVSADVSKLSTDPRTYEMLDSTRSTPALQVHSPGQANVDSNTFGSISPLSPEAKLRDNYFDRKTSVRIMKSPTPSNFSSPVTRYNSGVPQGWDVRATQTSPTSPLAPGSVTSKGYSES